jgi:protein-L-isoaspartate(D-aspartate) O-methyltransferase
MEYQYYQDELLEHCLKKYSLSEEVINAYRKCPRHKFIKKTYTLEEMYSDYPLHIYEDEKFVSTISQPSFVLLMIQMLDLRPFHHVLEIGAGSGWNAALMGCMVEKVDSIEIIPSLASETRENLRGLGFKNVEIICGDGARGFYPDAPYDRAVFTAGATDLPRAFHQQIKLGGKLLFVLKTPDVDLLLLMEKKNDYFEEISRVHCSFVPMKGEKSAQPSQDLSPLAYSDKKIKIYQNSSTEGKDSVFSYT